MPQVTDALSAKDGVLELNIDLITPSWDDLSGAGNTLEPDEQTRELGTAYTFDGDYAIITTGKRQPISISCRIVYTETADDPYDKMETAYLAGDKVQFQWFPAGKDDGNWQFKMDQAIITGFQRPPMDAGSPDPLMASFTIQANEIVRSVYSAP